MMSSSLIPSVGTAVPLAVDVVAVGVGTDDDDALQTLRVVGVFGILAGGGFVGIGFVGSRGLCGGSA